MEIWATPETKFEGTIFRVVAGGVTLDDGTAAYREVVEHPGGVCVLPYDGREVTFVRQYRIALDEYVLEAPAGKLEPGDTPIERARQELLEETGYYDGRLVDVGVVYGSVGFCSERIHLFLALNPSQRDAQPEAEERIDVQKCSLEDALAMARNGQLPDAKTLALLLKLQLYLEQYQ